MSIILFVSTKQMILTGPWICFRPKLNCITRQVNVLNKWKHLYRGLAHTFKKYSNLPVDLKDISSCCKTGWLEKFSLEIIIEIYSDFFFIQKEEYALTTLKHRNHRKRNDVLVLWNKPLWVFTWLHTNSNLQKESKKRNVKIETKQKI